MNLSIIVAFMCILKVFSQNFVSAEASEQREITGSVNNESSLVTTMSVNQSRISQSQERASQFAEPILSNFLQLLKNLNKVTRELGDSAPEREWNNFVTSTRYVNFRMVTLEKDYFAPKYISKELSLLRARKDCMWSCANNQSCLAFNLYDTANYYVCERLSDNLCVNRTRIAFAEWPGSTVWDKMSTGIQQSCVDARFPVGQDIPCEVLRPGCFGTWPQCSDCLRTCRDFDKLYNYFEKEFTIWPEGDGDFVLPIFALCYGSKVVMLKREVNVTNARLTYDYRMSLKDMHRISRLNVFSFILFEFFTTTDVHYYVVYTNWKITANGMLANLTSSETERMKDIFNLNGRALKPTPFVTVTDDRFGCGSFWLLDSKNATHCPGGQVSMLGKLKAEGGKVISTGMSIPEATQENEMIRLVRFRTAY